MIPGEYNMTIVRGGTLDVSLTAQDDLQVDINFDTDYVEYRMQVRPTWAKHPKSTARPLLLELTSANGGLAPAGTVLNVVLDAVSTAALDFNSGEYELEMVNRGYADWQVSTAYSIGNHVNEVGQANYFKCTTAGTTGASEPTWDTTIGNTTADGTVVWTCVDVATISDVVDKLLYGKVTVTGEITT